jgi:hypothetical protein
MKESAMSDELQDLWQSQNPEPIHMSMEEIRRKAVKLQRRVRWRNVREYVSCLAGIVISGRWIWTMSNPIMRAGSAVMVVSMLYVIYQLYRRGASREITGDCLEFHRRELERQRDAVASVWHWYLGPMVPPLLIWTIGSVAYNRAPRHLWFVAAFSVVCAAFFYGVGRLNQRAAGCLQRQIDELDKLR